MKRIAFPVLLALGLAACSGSNLTNDPEGPWQLTDGAVEGESIPIIDSHAITITFEGEQVSGTASCNGYGGTYELDGSSISFGDLAMTEMACAPPETMDAEQLFATGLTTVDTMAVDGDLTLTGPGVELVFEPLPPVPDAELTNTVWVLDALIQGDAVSTPALGTRATIEFFTDGSVLGDTGCRPFSGQYVISGSEVQITELAADGHECEPEVAEQDNDVISALEGGFRVEIDGDRLTTWARGNEGLSFVAES